MNETLRRALAAVSVVGIVLAACGDEDSDRGSSMAYPRELAAPEEPFGPDDPLYAEQPHRERPSALALSVDERELYVALQGTENDPARSIAIVDAQSLRTLARVSVGPGPCALAVHPAGRILVVLNRFARYASVIDLVTREVVSELAVPFYSEGLAFSHDGTRLFVTNRWKDSLLRFEVKPPRQTGALPRIVALDPPSAPEAPIGIALPTNPRRVLVSADDARVLVTSETALSLTMLDAETGTKLASHSPNAPVLDAAMVGDFVYVLHTGSGTNHAPDVGFDGDGDGQPGDGTANVGFQDVQNEIDVLRASDLERVYRYTSDSICCHDFRDVDPANPHTGEVLPSADAWSAERVAFLPPRDRWIVAGALPERVLPLERQDGTPALAVVFSASSEVQTFDLDADSGALRPRETADGGLYATGFGAADAVVMDGGARLVVVNRLSESLSALDLTQPPGEQPEPVTVGDVSGGEFPATDAELGEAFNFVTASFTVDGDQSCAHCHREGTAIGKAVSMPLLDNPTWGVRQIMSYRNAYDSRPWFMETAMNEENFFPVINEFARRENFCCEQTDTRIWSRYPTREQCLQDESLADCSHVLHCEDDPPPECDARSYGASARTRDAHFRAAALRVLGRDESFGDSLYAERVGDDGSVERAPVALGFTGITRALGIFLLAHSRELPNPNAALDAARAERGRMLYESSRTGCASCHPLPIAATVVESLVADASSPLRVPYVISPLRDPLEGRDVDVVTPGFVTSFPLVQQTEAGVRFGVPSLRGAWDRDRFLHHGLARSLTEALATPDHAALSAGERGFNERDGQLDTHGSTSHLDARELDDLIAFIRTL